MNKRKILGMTLILTVVLLLAATGVVAANGLRHGRGPTNWRSEQNFEDDHMWGPMHEFGWYSNQESGYRSLHSLMVESLAEISELSVGQIEARINNGEHLIAIASAAGVSLEDYYQMMVDTRRSYLEGAVEEGQISDEAYQWMFDHMNEIEGQSFYGGCHNFYSSEY
jgi:hypothetical protein